MSEKNIKIEALHHDFQDFEPIRDIDWRITSAVTNLVVMQLCQNYNFSDLQKQTLFKESDHILIMLQHAPQEYIMSTASRIEKWAYRDCPWFEDAEPIEQSISLAV